MTDERPKARKPRAPAAPTGPTTPDPIEIAMEVEASGVAATGVAHEVLRRQSQLLAWQVASERAGFALKVLTVLAGSVIAGLIGMMVWRAAHDESIVVEAFHIPPAYAQRGLDGEVLAGRFMDRLREVQRTTARGSLVTGRQLQQAAAGVRIEIPETGLSLGELQRLLAEWFGRRTLVSGALSEDAPGLITLDARVGAAATVRVTGPPDQIDALITRLAEKSFAVTMPNQESIYLRQTGRPDEALAVARAYSVSRTPGAAARLGFSTGTSLWGQAEGDFVAARRRIQRSVEEAPTGRVFRRALARADLQLGREDAALAEARFGLAMKPDLKGHDGFSERGQKMILGDLKYITAWLTGDFAGAAAETAQSFDTGDAAALTHDGSFRARLADDLADGRVEAREAARIRMRMDRAAADWPAMVADLAEFDRAHAAWMAAPLAPGRPPRASSAVMRARAQSQEDRVTGPLRAVALARTGRLAEARSVAAALPPDCAPCQRARAEVAELAGDPVAADAAFAAAMSLGGTSPLTETAWGASLLARGQPDRAIAKLSSAVAKGPRYADATELWGEALLVKGDAKGAAAKFAEAAKLAPRWGRLHLKWGEALTKLGKADEARAKWRAAATMDLSAADRAALKAHGV